MLIMLLSLRALCRLDAVEGFAKNKEGYDKLPDEALAALQKLVDELN